ncbi:adenylyltransferase/cytidyltransferase family protein [archaeon]|nr:adenylyltransferase/cytidyltransferase family protein [archaeon]
MEEKKKKVVAISGYFDPLHIGHLDLIKKAKKLGDHLVIIINTDQQTLLKKGKIFIPHDERTEIMKSLKMVDEVILSIDSDKTVSKTLEMIKPDIFANGGDKIVGRIPEQDVCEKYNIEIVNNLGEKLQSSSKLTGLPGTYEENK